MSGAVFVVLEHCASPVFLFFGQALKWMIKKQGHRRARQMHERAVANRIWHTYNPRPQALDPLPLTRSLRGKVAQTTICQ